MFFEVDLMSNGKIKDYPKIIYMDVMKIKHFSELSNAYSIGERAFDIVLSSILDDVIDFSRVEGIKSSNDLTVSDRLKLFFFQLANTKMNGSVFTFSFVCDKCKEKNVLEYDFNNLEEIKLTKEIGDKIIREKIFENNKVVEDKNGEIKLVLTIPRYRDSLNLSRIIEEHKEKTFNLIKEVRKGELDIFNQIKKLNESKKKYVMLKNNEDDNKAEIEVIDNNIKVKSDELLKLLTDEYIEKRNNEIESILKENYFKADDYNTLNSVDDLYCNADVIEMLNNYTIIKDNDRNFIDFINYFKELEYPIISDLISYRLEIHHGFNPEIKAKCKKCKKEVSELVTFTPIFFFQLMALDKMR